ncbi:hypothetical protein [Campylobacter concisus]|nr:hypothetical protein [Campylobacter concisus]
MKKIIIASLAASIAMAGDFTSKALKRNDKRKRGFETKRRR